MIICHSIFLIEIYATILIWPRQFISLEPFCHSSYMFSPQALSYSEVLDHQSLIEMIRIANKTTKKTANRWIFLMPQNVASKKHFICYHVLATIDYGTLEHCSYKVGSTYSDVYIIFFWGRVDIHMSFCRFLWAEMLFISHRRHIHIRSVAFSIWGDIAEHGYIHGFFLSTSKQTMQLNKLLNSLGQTNKQMMVLVLTWQCVGSLLKLVI